MQGATMLDVHPPHETTHNWKDFFIHIATICVGLLIAISLDQTVEYVHRVREGRDLRESLAHESNQILKNCEDAEKSLSIVVDWDRRVQQQISDASLHHQPLGSFPAVPETLYEIPEDPVYRAAKASGQLSLLSRSEVEAYSEVDTLMESNQVVLQNRIRAQQDLRNFIAASSFGQPAGTQPFSHASPEDLQHLYNLFIASGGENDVYRKQLRYLRGAEVAISHGERGLTRIEAAELQFNKLP
jgi:hypothetical protein